MTLSSTSSTQSVLLDQFDPAAGMLDQVTITVAVDASAEVEVTNLTPAAKATTVTLEVTASAAGPGGSGVTATAIDTASSNLAPNASFAFGVDATADEDQVVTDPAVLAGFVGTGTVTFNLTGLVGADVEGPSTWRGRGAMRSHGHGDPRPTTSHPNAPPTAVGTTRRRWPRMIRRRRSTCWPTTPTPTAARSSIASVTQPANGTVVITGGGTGLTYQPDPNYCNDPPGTTPTRSPTRSTRAARRPPSSVTVTCVDDPPIAVDDTATVAEDDAATTIDVLANDTDPDGGPIIVDVGDPAGQRHGGDHRRRRPASPTSRTPTTATTRRAPRPTPSPTPSTPAARPPPCRVTVTCVDDPPDRGRRHRDGGRGRSGDDDRRAGQRHRRRRRPDHDRLGDPAGQRHGGDHRRRRPASPTSRTPNYCNTRPAPPPTRSPTP